MRPHDVKIRTRMLVGFAIVLGLMVCIMFIGMLNMRSIRNNMDRLVSVNTQHLIASNQVGNSLREIGIALRSTFLSKDEEERKSLEEYIAKQSIKYREGLKKVEELTNKDDPKGLELIATIKSAEEGAVPLRNKAIEILSANKNEEALDYLNAVTRPAVHKWIVAVDALSDYQHERIKYRSEEAVKQYNRTNALMFILGCLAVALAVTIAICLTNSILSPLKEMVEVSNALANGDLTVRVKSTNAAETGQVLAAIDKMARQLQGIITELKTSADSIASASECLNTGSEQMNEGVVRQSERASQIATSSAQMSQTVIDVAKTLWTS
ncbi:MAG: methyl-accepting chemotaxis protein [Nitrospirae bacterium]|nr:methyl-accepting chemotaxis protein [Nitrospirota bacterium]